MRTNIFHPKMILLTACFSLLVAGAFAQNNSRDDAPKAIAPVNRQDREVPPPPPPPSGDAIQHPDQNDDEGPMALNLPDLTDDQQAKIKKSDLKNLQTMTPLKNQMREKRARLATLLATPPVNLKEADMVADEIGTLMTSIMKQQIRHDQEIRSFLTPDQQIIFDARPKPFLGPMPQKKVRKR